MKTNISIIDAMTDRALFARWFKNLETWRAWIVFLKSLFALPMNDEEVGLYRKFTGRQTVPNQQATEAWLIVGRRGGKSFICALIATFLSVFVNWRPFLNPGEYGTIMLIAADRRQARVLKRYISAFFQNIDLLRPLVVNETAESIELSTGVAIEIHTASFRSTRGYTVLAAILDEIAFWRDESSACPDAEVVNAIRPGMSTIPGAMLLALSSPYAKRGVLYEAFRDYFGVDGDVLVWQADSRSMNPSIPVKVVNRAYEKDQASADAEYGGQFRKDVESYIDRETIESLVIPGLKVRPPVPSVNYAAFCDPAGGSGADSMTLGIAHAEGDKAVLDLLAETKPPFSPDSTVKEFAAVLKQYGLHRTKGDRYSAEWVREKFQQHGVYYEVSERNRSELYGEVLPLFTTGQAELLDNEKMIAQFSNLERRTGRGKDIIDHPARSHDDLSNVVAGCLLEAQEGSGSGLDPGGIQVVSREERRAAIDDHFADLDREYAPWDRPPWPEGYEPFQ